MIHTFHDLFYIMLTFDFIHIIQSYVIATEKAITLLPMNQQSKYC